MADIRDFIIYGINSYLEQQDIPSPLKPSTQFKPNGFHKLITNISIDICKEHKDVIPLLTTTETVMNVIKAVPIDGGYSSGRLAATLAYTAMYVEHLLSLPIAEQQQITEIEKFVDTLTNVLGDDYAKIYAQHVNEKLNFIISASAVAAIAIFIWCFY